MTLIPFSRSHKGLDCWKIACLHRISWRNKWILTKLAQLYCCDMRKNYYILVTLIPFSRSHESSDCWKIAFLHHISRINGWILTKHVQLYCSDRDKNWLDFGALDPIRFWWPWPIFKVTLGLMFWKMAPIDRTHTHIHTHTHTHTKKKDKWYIQTFSMIGLFKLVGDIRFPPKTLF